MLSPQCNCYRIMTPSVVRLVPYIPHFYYVILSPLVAKSPRKMKADWWLSHAASLATFSCQNELMKSCFFSCITGSCYSEENRDDLVVFEKAAPTKISLGNARGEEVGCFHFILGCPKCVFQHLDNECEIWWTLPVLNYKRFLPLPGQPNPQN